MHDRMSHFENFNPNSGEPFETLRSHGSREITYLEAEAMKNQLQTVRLIVCTNGEKIDYPNGRDYPHGYLNEVETPELPIGIIRSGADILYSYNEKDFFVYLNLYQKQNILRFTYFYPFGDRKEGGFSFTISDLDNNLLHEKKGESLNSLIKDEYDLIMNLARYFETSQRNRFQLN